MAPMRSPSASFVAGSTPHGGGAVAFPVLTKVFGVPAADARTFSLSIQAVGMGTAAVVIMLLGLLMRLPWILDLLGAVAYVVALVLAGLLTFLLLGYALGFNTVLTDLYAVE